MALKIKGVDLTISTFREVDRRFKAAAAAEVELGAKEIAALARMFAPADRGDLVKSIRAQRVNDAGATKWRVKVGGMIGGRSVSEYALAAHEGFSTNRRLKGPYGQGRRTREKNARKAASLGLRPGQVGIGYLSRAFKQLAPQIKQRIRRALNDEVNQIARKHRKKK